jgi:hypothetical protein
MVTMWSLSPTRRTPISIGRPADLDLAKVPVKGASLRAEIRADVAVSGNHQHSAGTGERDEGDLLFL